MVGNGVVVDPEVITQELDQLAERDGTSPCTLVISVDAHVIMPWHQALDACREARGDQLIGTTRKGIGPTYEDKVAGRGMRLADFVDPARRRELWTRPCRKRIGSSSGTTRLR